VIGFATPSISAGTTTDRLGHFAQGFVPALIAREIILRRGIIPSRGWTAFFAVCVAMTISAVYELIEWITAAIYGQNADAFLGGQGDIGTPKRTWAAR
jgi:putative membrane protein